MKRLAVYGAALVMTTGLACSLADLTGESLAELEARQVEQDEQMAKLLGDMEGIQADLASEVESLESTRSELADQAGQLQRLNRQLEAVVEQVSQFEQQLTVALQPSGELLLADDFSNPSSGWEVGKFDTGTVGYGSGVYVVTAYGFGDTMWGVANRRFDNVMITVQATQIQAPSNDNNDYGVVCRLQPNGNGYFLLVSGDGFYAILRADDDDFVTLIDWETASVIRQGASTNEISVTCDGSSLSLTINGELVASVQDSTYSSGDLALTATSYEDTLTEVHFDNLRVTRP